MARSISNRDDVIDSRDVIKALADLEERRDGAKAECTCEPDEDATILQHAEGCPLTAEGNWTSDKDDTLFRHNSDWDQDEEREYQLLKSFAEEGEMNGGDWLHGETLVRDSYFETYVRELAEDIGACKNTSEWPGRCIDWEQAAEELQQDYSSIEWDGVTYWIRA